MMNRILLLALMVAVIALSLWLVLTFLSKPKTTEKFYEGTSPKVIIVHASWCKYCNDYLSNESYNGKNAFDAAATEVGDKVQFEKMDFDENKELASQYGVNSFPSIVGVDTNNNVRTFSGNRDDVSALVDFANSLM